MLSHRRRHWQRPRLVTAVGVLGLSCACWFVQTAKTESPPATAATQPNEPGSPSSVPQLDTTFVAAPAAESGMLGKELFARHCAACHGADGNGQGIAGRFVFPKPRDFQSGQFRLISTSNNVPSRDDLHAVLLRGMPGSSMPPWGHLSQPERDALIDEVMRLRSLGAQQRYIKMLKEDELLTDEEIAAADVQQDIQEFAERFTTPGESTAVPEIGTPTAEGMLRARETYAKFACLQCHGAEGKGDGVQKMIDELGHPTAPRDFTAGIFKGGSDPASLYRRIAYGMPGTPMPSANQLTPDQIVDLVHLIRSMSTEEQREQAVLKRERIVVRRIAALPADGNATNWSNVPAVKLRTMPLWWRNDADPGLQVQAAHDGRSIAVRMTWKDMAANDLATRSEAFEDGIAIELYRGPTEPFIGMGDPRVPLDVWYWDADRQRAADVDIQYPRMVADIYPFNESQVETAEFQREGTQRDRQPPISLAAKAVGNAIVPGDTKSGASNLTGGGPGSTTFRIPFSQLVSAQGDWSDDRWTVVMRRPLAIPENADGVPLVPGETVSAAFAIWNGSFQDRDGRKVITIWQDLQLEP